MDIANFIVALAAALLAIWSIRFAASSKKISQESRDIADDSRDIAGKALTAAEEANVIAGRAEAREKERHDVTWDLDTSTAGRYVLTNTGPDIAHDVHATLTLDQRQPVAGQLPRVAPNETIVFDIGQAAHEFAQEMQERAAAQQQAQNSQFGTGSYLGDYSYYMHHFDLRVSWVTALGVQRTFENAERDSLGTIPD